jgi:hypothetical protein
LNDVREGELNGRGIEREKFKNFGFPPAVQVQKLTEKMRAALTVRQPTVGEALSTVRGAAVRAD